LATDYAEWKKNWRETQDRFKRWWAGEDLILGMFGTGVDAGTAVHDQVPDPGLPADLTARHMDPEWVSRQQRYKLSRMHFAAETLPIAFSDMGTVTLATFLGSTPEFAQNNIWYAGSSLSPDNDRDLVFDPTSEWWLRLKAVVSANAALAGNDYLCGMPAIAPNLDVLAELRGFENVLMDLLERPEWVHEKLAQINSVYYQAYDELYDLVKLPDDSSVFQWFMIWGPGKVSQAQCDVAGMISPTMFREFVVPHLREQCIWLDHTLYHVDGPDALGSVDPLLEIDELDAIEFTPGPQVPAGGDPSWYPLYRKILDAGKSVQVADVGADEIIPLLDAIGGKGVYILGFYDSLAQLEDLARAVEPYR
jgi:hypothetical protein